VVATANAAAATTPTTTTTIITTTTITTIITTIITTTITTTVTRYSRLTTTTAITILRYAADATLLVTPATHVTPPTAPDTRSDLAPPCQPTVNKADKRIEAPPAPSPQISSRWSTPLDHSPIEKGYGRWAHSPPRSPVSLRLS
jgi:hypothetical protein